MFSNWGLYTSEYWIKDAENSDVRLMVSQTLQRSVRL